MIVVTTETIAGRQILKTLGLVRGNTIRARHVGRDITAGLKGLFGGEISDYTKLMAESQNQSDGPQFFMEDDPRVLKVESDEIVAAVRKNGVPVEYVLFDDEGHDVIKFKNKVQCYNRIVEFFTAYLKP